MTKKYKNPDWLSAGIISAGCWEPLIARKRAGQAWAEEAKWYEKEHAEEAVRELAKIGVNTIITAYYKGFGLETEKPDMEYTKKICRLAHKHGLKLGVYIRWDNIMPETIVNEEPDALEWLRVDQDGKHPGYDYYRLHICFNKKGYEEYLKKVVAYAIRDVGADCIFFDGGWGGAEGRSCHCDTCREKFTEYLKSKYPKPDMAKERFGFADLSHIQPPPIIPERPLASITVIRDPVRQEWMEFRAASFTSFHHQMSRFIKELNPEAGICLNSGARHTVNALFYGGIDQAALGEENDIFFDENYYYPEINEDGVLIGRISLYKMSRALQNSIITYHIGSRTGRQIMLSFSEAMAFNKQTIGEITGGFSLFPEKLPFFAEKKECLGFYTVNKEYYLATETLANVAIWISRRASSLNCVEPHQSAALFEQALIQGHVPFDLVLDRDLADLKKYRVLVLPNVDAMSAEEIKTIEAYMKAGGGVVATEDTSRYDQWHRRLTSGGLNGILNLQNDSPEEIKVFDPQGRELSILRSGSGCKESSSEIRRECGQGRFVYLTSIKKAMPYLSREEKGWTGHDNPPMFRKLPCNHRQMIEAVRWAGQEGLPLATDAPQSVVMELLHQPAANRVILHLLNYDLNGQVAKDINIKITMPGGGKVDKIIVLSLTDNTGRKELPFQVKGGEVSFSVPGLDIYNLVVIE